jgi:uncharacterized membrane protein YdjX (TVP38/TMEM64 family)
MLEFIKHILIDYPIAAPVIFIIVRIIPVVIPPIPGLLLDVIGIAVFGWLYGFILAEIAIVLAAMISFYIGRRFREPLLKRFISIQKINEWEDKLSEKEKFWGLVGLRFVSSPFFDIVNYIAGLTKIKASTYLFTTILVSAPMGFIIYYFGGMVLSTPIILLGGLVILIPFFIWNKKKNGQSPDMM